MASERGYPEIIIIPLLGASEGELAAEQKWWNKILDWEEAQNQIVLSIPMSLASLSHYLIPLVSVMFAGHLGELQLAGATLANSWAVVTGWAFAVGLSGALETLCGQGYGAKLHGILGMYLQASCVISFLFCILLSTIWWYSEIILTSLHQDPEIAKEAGLYLKFLIPGLFAYSLLQNILRFLQAQSVVLPLVFCSVIPLLFHIPFAYILVHWTFLGYYGAALAASISIWVSTLMLTVYILRSKRFKQTWGGFSKESLKYIPQTLQLALPSAAMVCLEYWAFELLVLVAGLMPNPEISTSLIAICENTEATAYMIAYGLSASASTRVSNELGAGNPAKAKQAMTVSIKLCAFLTLAMAMALAFGHNNWASLFTDSPVITQQFASMTPLLIASIVVDIGSQGVLSGVARGCGWQNLAVINNLATYYFVGMTSAIFLAFKLQLYAKGLWLGLICGLCCQACGLLLLTVFTKWTKLELKGQINSFQNPCLRGRGRGRWILQFFFS